ncbi:MAG: glycoside hydrolase family 88 protein [Bacteroidaceae bacterium]|nr:glycoside hydrolase family 88 protein [Bacteroidaceae bacterium]
MKRAILNLFVTLVILAGHAQVPQSSPESSPERVLHTARLVNSYFMQKHPDPTTPTNVRRQRSSNLWTRAVYYEGLMALYAIDPDTAYLNYTDRWAEFHQWTPRDGVRTTNADNQCCAQTYLDRYMQEHNDIMFVRVKENLDHQMQTKIGWWTWVDAIQMAMPVYTKMYRITGEERYLEHAMKMYIWTRDTLAGGLFNEREGLWWRDKDFVPPYKEPDGSNCYWSRGCGWAYAALVKAMEDISSRPLNSRSHSHLKLLTRDFGKMSRALRKCQRTDGLWNPSLLCPTNYGGKELTGSALFLYGMSWGLRNGILKPRHYLPACHKAWAAMVRDCVHPDGFLGYVQGTGKEPKSAQPVASDRVPDFEDFGTGCFLLGAAEYYTLLISQAR